MPSLTKKFEELENLIIQQSNNNIDQTSRKREEQISDLKNQTNQREKAIISKKLKKIKQVLIIQMKQWLNN